MVGKNPAIAVYIMASGRNGTLYTGVTSKLGLRVEQHKLGTFGGFSKQHGCKTLVWSNGSRRWTRPSSGKSRSSAGGEIGSWR
jgi:predicted GIY-YIG superfamily endonuclease